MNTVDKQYLDLLKDIKENGVIKETRSGKVISVFDRTMRFDLKKGLPCLTTKKMFFKGVIHELLWFLKGETNIHYLVVNNVHIWDDDAYRFYLEKIKKHNELQIEFDNCASSDCLIPLSKEEFIDEVKKQTIISLNSDIIEYKKRYLAQAYYCFGYLGPVYGKQMRRYGYKNFDQINDIINKLKNNPEDRRMLMLNWNPDVLDEIALPACHVMALFNTTKIDDKYHLNCSFLCRSQDVPLGTPYNILSYAILTHMIAQCCNMEVGELIYHGMDCHIYLNQMDGVNEQLQRDPLKYDLPQLQLNPNIKDIDDFTFDDINIINYNSYPKIKFPLSVGL